MGQPELWRIVMKLLQSIVLSATCSYASFTMAGIAELNAVEQAFNAPTPAALIQLADVFDGFDGFVANYRLAIKYQYSNEVEKAKSVAQALVPALETYSEANPSDAEALALLANIYGYTISLLPEKAMAYGPLSQQVMKKAIALDPENARVLFFKGSLEYSTPTMFGGSKVKARESLITAISAYENDVASERYWGHADAIILLGLTYLEEGKLNQAREHWQQALAVQPDNGWAHFLLTQHTL